MVHKNYRMIQFMDKFKDVKLHEFYQLPNTSHEHIKIKTKVEDLQTLSVWFDYKKFSDFPRIDLPREIVKYIYEYIPEYVHIQLKVTLPNDYPFKPHIWETINVSSNIQYVNTLMYYKMILDHMRLFDCDWSPAMSLDKDILILIEKFSILIKGL